MSETPHCDPKEIALKSLFLGIQAENAPWVRDLVDGILDRWVAWRRSLYPQDGKAISPQDQETQEFRDRHSVFSKMTQELLMRFEKEVPKFSPRYVGHMFSETSLPALIGHLVTLLHNPNNISGESSRVGIQIEDEAIAFLAQMVGYPAQEATGHFTSGGTIANFESLMRAYSRLALWLSVEAVNQDRGEGKNFSFFRAAHMGWERFDEKCLNLKRHSVSEQELSRWNIRMRNPFLLARKFESLAGREFLGPVLLVPENKHYSWKKGCRQLGLGDDSLWPIELDALGRLSISSLEQRILEAQEAQRPILLVVSVVGTTELGGVDPVDEVQACLDQWREKRGIHIWHHVDAAYGGFFRTLDLEHSKALPERALQGLKAVPHAQSVTLDPHKLGYVPYASGAFLARNPRDYYFNSSDSVPYIDFNQKIDRGPYTLEGSRSAAGAVATWMTAKTTGLHPNGYGLLLERTARIRGELAQRLLSEGFPFQMAPGCDTNILCFSCAKKGEPLSLSNARTLKLFEAFSPRGSGEFIVSKTALTAKSYGNYLKEWTASWDAKVDADEVVLVRMCLMNPFFSSIQTQVNFSNLLIESIRNVLSEC